MKLRHKKLDILSSPWWRLCDPSLHRFDTIQQCDRRTDGWTDAQAMAKTCEAFCYRAKKTLQTNIVVNDLYDTKLCGSNSLASYRLFIAMLVRSVFFIYLNFCYYRSFLLTFIFHKVL